jgi:hypothetical protein
MKNKNPLLFPPEIPQRIQAPPRYVWETDVNRIRYFVCIDCGALLLLRSHATIKNEKQLRCHKHWLKNSNETV